MPNPSVRSLRTVPARVWFLLGLLLIFVGVGYSYSKKASSNRSALPRWRPQILELANGVNISERYHYGNPPIMALLLYPLLKLEPLAAAMTWFALKVGFALVSFWWVFRLVETADRPVPPWVQGVVVLLTLRPILGDLQHGNVNLFILFLVMGALTAYRYRRDVLAGLILALAIACKLTPALFLPYFLWKRAWRLLAGATVALALFFWPGIVPALILGAEENHSELVSWYHKMVAPFLEEGKVWAEHNNQSLVGLSYRLLTDSPSFSHYEGDEYTPDAWHNVANLDRGLLRWLLKGSMAVFALAVVVWCRTPVSQSRSRPDSTAAPPRQGWQLSAEFALILLGILLFSERTWKHYCVTLMLPFAVLCYYLATCHPSKPLRIYLLSTLVAVVLLMESTSTELFGKDIAKMAQVYGAYVWAYLLLMVALFVLLQKNEPQLALSKSYFGAEYGS